MSLLDNLAALDVGVAGSTAETSRWRKVTVCIPMERSRSIPTRAYTEIDGLDDGRTMFAIVSFEGVLNFTAEGRLYYRSGAHLHTLLDVDGTLPRSISTPSRDRLSGNLVDDFDD